MKTVFPASKSLHLPSITLVGAMAIVCASPAAADRKNPAPIVYATGTSPYPAGQPQYIEPSRAPDAQSKKQARIQFRYPGQSGSGYADTSLNGAEQGAEPAAPASRQYASIEPPAPAYGSTAAVSSSDSFDARAAAARIEAQRQADSIESEALPSLTPTPAPAAPLAAPVEQVAPSTHEQAPASAVEVAGAPVPVFDETGVAIVYGDEYNGLPTANGEVFDQNAMTAAHPTLPLPSLIQVVNTETGREVVLRVNDRGPFEDGADLQISQRAAGELGMNGAGKATLRIRYLGTAPAMTVPAAPAPQMVAETTAPAPVQPTAEPDDYLEPVAYAPAQAEPQPQPVYQYSQPTSAPAGDYFVQIGSFTDISNAQTLSNQVQASLPVSIVPARVNGADYFRVRVGPLANRNDAEQARQTLSYAGIAQARIIAAD